MTPVIARVLAQVKSPKDLMLFNIKIFSFAFALSRILSLFIKYLDKEKVSFPDDTSDCRKTPLND